MPKADARAEKNQIKISPIALLKTGRQEWKMTGQTKQDKSNDCLTAVAVAQLQSNFRLNKFQPVIFNSVSQS